MQYLVFSWKKIDWLLRKIIEMTENLVNRPKWSKQVKVVETWKWTTMDKISKWHNFVKMTQNDQNF